MADYRLSGYTTEASFYAPNTNSLGLTFSESTTTPFNTTQWNLVRTAEADGSSITANTTRTSVYRSDSDPSLALQRVFLQFSIPSNLARLDNTPQLVLNCLAKASIFVVVALTSLLKEVNCLAPFKATAISTL